MTVPAAVHARPLVSPVKLRYRLQHLWAYNVAGQYAEYTFKKKVKQLSYGLHEVLSPRTLIYVLHAISTPSVRGTSPAPLEAGWSSEAVCTACPTENTLVLQAFTGLDA